jgi:hypothetical protein
MFCGIPATGRLLSLRWCGYGYDNGYGLGMLRVHYSYIHAPDHRFTTRLLNLCAIEYSVQVAAGVLKTKLESPRKFFNRREK